MRRQLTIALGVLAVAFCCALGVATAASAAPSPAAASASTVSLTRADGSVLHAALATSANGAYYVVDSSAVHAAAQTAGLPAGTVAAVTPFAEGCDSGYVCIYQNSNATGARLEVLSGYGLPDLRQWPCSGCNAANNWNDVMSSWRNNSSATGCWFWNIQYGGESHPMYTGNYVQNVLPRENDQASSFRGWSC